MACDKCQNLCEMIPVKMGDAYRDLIRKLIEAPFSDANSYRFTLVMMYGVSASRSG
jgi:hypothetical protein